MNGKLIDTNVIIRYIKNESSLDDIFENEIIILVVFFWFFSIETDVGIW